MPIVSIVVGALLVGVGLWGYQDASSATALIPAFVGAPLILAGGLALKESFLKHAMHAAAMIGLLGFLGGVGNIVRVAIKGGDLTGKASISTILMTVLCAAFVALCVNSFIQVRRRRVREAAAQVKV